MRTPVLQAAVAEALHRLAPTRAAWKMRQSSRAAEAAVGAVQHLDETRQRRSHAAPSVDAVASSKGTVTRNVSVSNSLSGGDRELDEVPAVGDPAHVAEIGKGLRVSTDERRRCMSLQ